MEADKGQLYIYECNDVRYNRKDNPSAWTTIAAANGAMFRSYPAFSFIPGTRGDEDPVRYGDFVIDIDTGSLAPLAAIKILDWFSAIYAVDQDQWRVYLSGKKGVHLELPAEILGTENGHVLLPLAYKRLAKDIEGELSINLDTSMYNRGTGKPYRQPNVMRDDTKTCKRQVEVSDLYEITDEEGYKSACNEPGETWQPGDTTRNHSLAARIAEYLDLATREQAIVELRRTMTDDERDKLAITTPACISVLANLIDSGKTSATFNDVAIQLCAYAISAGRSEHETVAGCQVFIEHYPSTSLNTLDKRYENFRARFRTMSANGYQHSCGGILSLGFPGFDCSECHAKMLRPLADRMSREDLNMANRTTIVEDNLYAGKGLISVGMKALRSPGMPDIVQYNLPVVLTTIARAISGKITCCGVWPNVYNIKIGPTSSGKTSSDHAVISAINNAVNNFYGPTDFASGPALLRALADTPVCLVVVDEATPIFRRYAGKPDIISDGKRDALLELFSRSGSIINKAYSDNKKSILIEYPCLSLVGNATPVVLDEIKQEDFDTGTLQRFDFWCYDGDLPERGVWSPHNEDMATFVDGLLEILSIDQGGGNLTKTTNIPFEIGATAECNEMLKELSIRIISESNETHSDGERGIISRKYNLSIKYGMIHAAATRKAHDILSPLACVDLTYGISVATVLAEWKLKTLKRRVLTGEFHKQCEIFKEAISATIKSGRRPTFKILANRRPELKNWKRKESEEVIKILEKRGEIVLDDSQRKTAYFIAKEDGCTE